MIADIAVALGLVLVIEGLLYALFPGQLKQMLLALLKMPEEQLRVAGLAAMAAGVLVVWVARGFG